MKIAITGTIGSGKSTVCEYIRSKGYDVFDCDLENKYLLENDSKTLKNIAKHFPECIVDNKIDKKILSSIVFNDAEKKELLESIMHPLILERLLKRKDNPLFAEVPLLFEVDWDEYFDVNILVISNLDLVYKRLEERGLDIQEIENILNNQMDVEEKLKRADKIIYNNGSLDDLYVAVDKIIEEILC